MCTVVATHHLSIRHLSNVVNIARKVRLFLVLSTSSYARFSLSCPNLIQRHTRWPLALVIPQTTSRRSNRRRRRPPLLLWQCMARGGHQGAQLEAAVQCLGRQRGSHLGAAARAQFVQGGRCAPGSLPLPRRPRRSSYSRQGRACAGVQGKGCAAPGWRFGASCPPWRRQRQARRRPCQTWRGSSGSRAGTRRPGTPGCSAAPTTRWTGPSPTGGAGAAAAARRPRSPRRRRRAAAWEAAAAALPRPRAP
jgi:hypothetical protein